MGQRRAATGGARAGGDRGALAARRLGPSALWAAALLLPAAVVLPIQGWPYDFAWYWDGRRAESGPWLLLRLSMGEIADILLPLLFATALVTALGAAIWGTRRVGRAAVTLGRSTLAGFAVFVATIETVAGIPSVPGLAGCLVLGAVAALTDLSARRRRCCGHNPGP